MLGLVHNMEEEALKGSNMLVDALRQSVMSNCFARRW